MITHFNRDNLVMNLPDAYSKTADSNNHKIISIEKSTMDTLREAIRAVDDSLDIDKATGKTLDLYGEMLGQERGKATDEQYRLLIRSRIVRNMVNGDYNSIVTLLALIFGCEPTDFVITETDVAVVTFEKLPYAVLNRAAIDVATSLKVIREVMPAGVRMGSVSFTGTFEFSAGTELVYDETAGFADAEQTIGGYFGYVFSDEESDLPV